MIKELKGIANLKKYICSYLQNECDYEYLEDYIIQYSKENKKSVNLDYVRNRITDLYKIQGTVGITTEKILMDHILDYFRLLKK